MEDWKGATSIDSNKSLGSYQQIHPRLLTRSLHPPLLLANGFEDFAILVS